MEILITFIFGVGCLLLIAGTIWAFIKLFVKFGEFFHYHIRKNPSSHYYPLGNDDHFEYGFTVFLLLVFGFAVIFGIGSIARCGYYRLTQPVPQNVEKEK